jgi:cell division protease FtsH
MDKKNQAKNIIYIIILVLIGLTFYSYFNPQKSNIKNVSISEIANDVKNGQIKSIEVKNNDVTAIDTQGVKLHAIKEPGIGLFEYGITADKTQISVIDTNSSGVWSSILSILIPFLLISLFLYFLLRQAQGGNMKAMSFGKTSARLFGAGNKKTTFKDVAGSIEAKQELIEVVEFLKSPKKFKDLGAEIPKGVLLAGPPGCGKTLLAKAVAGEAGVPFFSLSASEFVEMFVGVGASRVRDLFQKAKKNAPCVIFIDELDAIGRQRGTGLGGSHDEREQTLNQILVEMDGFETDDKVIVLAATNRPDVLDPALLRPGRFDRRVMLGLPDKSERLEILKIHSIGKPLAKDVNLEKIAQTTAGLSGADLRNIINEGAIIAARTNKKEVGQHDLQEAIEKNILGPEKKSRVLSDQEKKISAFHESGHAVVGHILPNCDPIHKVSIVSRGMALGYTWSLPLEDKHLYSKSKFEDEIAQLLAGREAEKIIFGETTTGAENDIKRASKIARDMVKVYAMSDKLAPVVLGEREEMVFLGRELGEHKNFSEKTASLIDEEIENIILRNQKRAHDTLIKNKATLDKLTEKLLKDETVEGKELDKILK